MKPIVYTLRALARLVSYPDQSLRDQSQALIEVIDQEAVLSPSRRDELRALAHELIQADSYAVESRYVETFDRGRATSLHLFEHVHGDSRERGPAMIDLCQTYAKAGMLLSDGELPDHLAVVLEFASTQPLPLAQDFLAEVSHILRAVFSALVQRESAYASVLAAVLELAGEPVEAVAVKPDEALDASWTEPVAFDGCTARGQVSPGQAQPIHFIRPSAPQGAAA